MKKYIAVIALMLVVFAGTALAMGKTNPVSLRTCGYQMNACYPYDACGTSFNDPTFKACAKNYVDACAVTKFDGNGVRCTVAQGELAWGFLWK